MRVLIRTSGFLSCFLFLLFSIYGFSEGTKQIMPAAGGAEKIHITVPQSQQNGFAWLNCPDDNRLKIHIKEIGEIFYFGFQKTQTGSRQFQIRDPNGTVVLGPQNMPGTGEDGYIDTYDEAVEGPSQIVGASGYDALLFTPLLTGDYSIEFQATTTLQYFDITVADTSNEPIEGRIWSKAWQFSTGQNPGLFTGALYVYSDDGIVTILDLNGMQGIVFTVACNQFGCPDPNNPGDYTRKSVNGQNVIPQYKIFLNDPDTLIYPTGTLGEVSNLLIVWNCNGTATISFNATLAGTMDILLDINPLSGVQPEDVLISHISSVGPNVILWDGLNGLGEPVLNATIFNVIVTYIQGLTNFPVYDVEQNANGYIVSLVRPTGPVPNLYWDDLDLEIHPLTNCGTYTPLPPDANYGGCPGNTGCHTWLAAGPGNPSQCSYPNRNTANTWWYAVYSTSILPDFEVHRVPFPPGDPTGPLEVCPGEQQQTYTTTAEPNSTTYEWEYTGTGVTFNPLSPTGLTATLDFDASATSGEIRVRGWNSNCGFGEWASTTITVFPTPDLTNTPPFLDICDGQSTGITLTSSVIGATFTWTCTQVSGNITGWSGNPGPPTTIIDQTLELTGVIEDSVIYHITPQANGCIGTDTNFTVVVNPIPELTLPQMVDSICSETFTSLSLTATTAGTNYTWTSTQGVGTVTGNTDGSGSIINDQLFNALSTQGSVLYTITPATSKCTGNDTLFTMWVKPLPHLTNTPPDTSICNGQSPALPLQSDVPNTLFTWTATGSTGNISGYSDQTTPTTLLNQTLVNSGFDTEWVIYHVTPMADGCTGPVTDYTVTVFPIPDVFFVPDGETVCEGIASSIQNQSHVTGTTFSWTAVASSPNLSGYADGSGDWIAQTIDNAGATIETVTYNVTPEANGCPPGTTLAVILNVNPRPAVTNAVTSFAICNNATTAIPLQADVTGSTFAWRAFASSGNLSGFSNSSGPNIAQTLVNAGYDIDSVTYRVAATANGCIGDSTDFNVVVYPVTDVIFVPDGDTICSRQSTGISLQSNVTGTTFSWTASGSSPEISGYSIGSGNLIQQVLYNAGYLPGWVTYQVTPTANGCIGTQNSAVVIVDPVPAVSLPVCFDTVTITTAKPIRLHGGIPLTGTYSGPGVDQPTATLYPGIAGAGSHQITYSYINDFDCTDSSSLTIHISNPISHICGDTLIDPRDSLPYPTVEINGQCWMAANLNYGTPIASSQMQRDNCVNEKYCYNDNPANCISFGGLYKWNEMMSYTTGNGVQGLCPPGWHIPSEAEWNTLFAVYISSGFAGSALKIIGYSGFDALLSGIRFHNNIWKFPGNDPILRSILYWSSTIHGPDKAWAHGLNEVVIDIDYTPSVSFYPALRSNAFAVRCLRD